MKILARHGCVLWQCVFQNIKCTQILLVVNMIKGYICKYDKGIYLQHGPALWQRDWSCQELALGHCKASAPWLTFFNIYSSFETKSFGGTIYASYVDVYGGG